MTKKPTIFGPFFCKDPSLLLAGYSGAGLYAQLLGRFRPALPYSPEAEMQEWLAGFAWAAEFQSQPETALRFPNRKADVTLYALLSPRSAGFSRGAKAFLAAYEPGYHTETPVQEPDTANDPSCEFPFGEASRTAAALVNANLVNPARVEVFRRGALVCLQVAAATGQYVTFSLEPEAARTLADMLGKSGEQPAEAV